MKKLFFTLALVLGLAAAVSAQESGLFGLGPTRGGYEDYSSDYQTRDGFLNLPGSHGADTDVTAPLGMGTAVLIGLGAAYAMTKKNRKE